jgi:hypothetical protein
MSPVTILHISARWWLSSCLVVMLISRSLCRSIYSTVFLSEPRQRKSFRAVISGFTMANSGFLIFWSYHSSWSYTNILLFLSSEPVPGSILNVHSPPISVGWIYPFYHYDATPAQPRHHTGTSVPHSSLGPFSC